MANGRGSPSAPTNGFVDAPRAFLVAIGAGTLGAVFRDQPLSGLREGFWNFLTFIYEAFPTEMSLNASWFLKTVAFLWLIKLFLDDYYFFNTNSESAEPVEGYRALIAFVLTTANFYILFRAIGGDNTEETLSYFIGFFGVLLLWSVLGIVRTKTSHLADCKRWRGILAVAFVAIIPRVGAEKWRETYEYCLKCKRSAKGIQIGFCILYVILALWIWRLDGDYSPLAVIPVIAIFLLFFVDLVLSGTLIFRNREELLRTR